MPQRSGPIPPKADAIEATALPPVEALAANEKKRPCYDRDCELERLVTEAEGKNDLYKWAWARAEYNKNCGDEDHIAKGRSGRDLVREATRKIRAEREKK